MHTQFSRQINAVARDEDSPAPHLTMVFLVMVIFLAALALVSPDPIDQDDPIPTAQVQATAS